MPDLYDLTQLSSPVPGAPQIRIASSVLDMATGRRYLNADLRIVVQNSDNGIRTEITLPLDPGTMRAMARVLVEHATRITDELMPLVHAARPDPEALAIYRALEADHVG